MKTPFDEVDELNEEMKCPLCNSYMVLKVNGNTGVEFWGCSKYPDCNGKRSKPKTDNSSLKVEQSLNCIKAKLDMMMHMLTNIEAKLEK